MLHRVFSACLAACGWPDNTWWVAKTVGGWRALILPGSPHSGLLRSPIPIVELISCILHGNEVRKENVLGLTGQAGQPDSEGREESPEKEGV